MNTPPSAQAEAVATPLRVIAERVVTEHAYLERREHWFTGLESMALALASEAVKASVALDAAERALVAMTRERDRYHAALEYYADDKNWDDEGRIGLYSSWLDAYSGTMEYDFEGDNGEVAQIALGRVLAPVPDGGESSQ